MRSCAPFSCGQSRVDPLMLDAERIHQTLKYERQ